MDYILAGCGADELIDLIKCCTLEGGDKIVDCPPTLTMYAFDAAAVKEHSPKMIFLTSPNNPTSSLIIDEDLMAVLALPLLVVLDEAYIEFADQPSRMKVSGDTKGLEEVAMFNAKMATASAPSGDHFFVASSNGTHADKLRKSGCPVLHLQYGTEGI
ncbi:hypothetical protein SELMODRAFT_408231 [Selaginella moellendorffii]|uniref:histidinol-phosphate transaminase n=1 Tax=Selaginella moellendorffii TaxID=88036 RepID=D8R7M1_SELML|nr:hypothetical protein SELMODRAFT_408231 [Selaginella moellendorffii]